MKMRSRARPRAVLAVASFLALVAAGCAYVPGSGGTTATAVSTPASTAASLPAMAAVSASKPSAEAMRALDACGITNFDPARNTSGTIYGIGIVTGMGLVTPGRDAGKYAPIGPAPELDTDKPLWVITTDAEWRSAPLAAGEVRNATCVVEDVAGADSIWFVTGDERVDGIITTPVPLWPATLRLPSLAP